MPKGNANLTCHIDAGGVKGRSFGKGGAKGGCQCDIISFTSSAMLVSEKILLATAFILVNILALRIPPSLVSLNSTAS